MPRLNFPLTLTQDEITLLEQYADKHGVTLSDTVVQCIHYAMSNPCFFEQKRGEDNDKV